MIQYNALKAQIASMKKKSSRNKKTSDEEMTNHSEAEDAINKKAKVLITPPVKKNSVVKDGGSGYSKSITSDSQEKESKGESTSAKFQNANVRFETANNGPNGVIFEADQVGKTIVITWNVDHPFYARFVRENSDNKTLVTSVDFLIYSLAAAQIQATGDDDEKVQMIENIIAIMSTNMKVLLS